MFLRDRAPHAARAKRVRDRVHALVEDRGAADQELDALRRRNVVRPLRLPLASAPIAYAFVSDYVASVAAAAAAASPATGAAAAAALAAALPSLRGTAPLPHAALLTALGGDADGDAALAALLRCGAVARDPATASTSSDGGPFLLGAPAAGPFLTALRAGRTLLTRTLARKRYKQAAEGEVVGALRRAARPRLGARFLLRDGVGSGAVVRVRAAGGDVLRLP